MHKVTCENCGNLIDLTKTLEHYIATGRELGEGVMTRRMPKGMYSEDTPKPSIWVRLSWKFLRATIIKRKKSPSMKTWGRQLKAFAKREDIKYTRIKKVMRWYCGQFDESNPYTQKYLPLYVPQTTAMSGFIRKFFDIEIAMMKELGEEDAPS